MRDLQIIFRQHIQLKCELCLLKIKMLNIFVCDDVFTKYVSVKHLKDKKSKTVLNAFIKIANESNHKPNELQVDQGRELYNKILQK